LFVGDLHREIEHRNIIKMHGITKQKPGSWAFVTESISVRSLHDVLHGDGAKLELSLKDALCITQELAAAMEKLHQHNIIHCGTCTLAPVLLFFS
jgi:serine/threonine protein kinase